MSNMLVLIVGPSGSGKSTLEKNLSEKYSNYYGRIISHTTRPMRKNEKNGKEYYFINEEEFNQMEENGEFIEVVNFLNYKYGCSKFELEKEENKNKDILLVVEPEGMMQIIKTINSDKKLKDRFKPIILYMDILEKERIENMKKRGDPEKIIKERLNDRIAERFKQQNILPDIIVRKLYPSLFKDVHNQLMLYKKLYIEGENNV